MMSKFIEDNCCIIRKNNDLSNMRKQTSLGAFGFTKIVTSKDQKPELVDISKVAEKEKPHTCSICKENAPLTGLITNISNRVFTS